MVIEDTNKLAVKDRIKAAILPKKKEPKRSNNVDEAEAEPPYDPRPRSLSVTSFTGVDLEFDAREERGHWKHPLDFLFSCISVSVGLGSKQQQLIYNKIIITFGRSDTPTSEIFRLIIEAYIDKSSYVRLVKDLRRVVSKGSQRGQNCNHYTFFSDTRLLKVSCSGR